MNTCRIACLTSGFILINTMGGSSFSASADTTAAAGNVSESRVLAEGTRGPDWLVSGGSFGSQHYSALKQIDDKNVSKLGLAWSLDIDSPMGMAAEPIVVDGTIYLTASMDRVFAIDAASGRVLWKYYPDVRLSVMRNSALARTNRGVAVWEGKVYVGTGDCRIIALDAASGRKLWDSPVCVDTTQSGVTGAPRVAEGKVFIGYNGSDSGVRGSLVAFDANTGKLAWRFWNVPGDTSKPQESKALEMAAKTWSGDQWWNVGGGDVWDPITYDPANGYIIYGTAGATPEALYGDRAGMKVSGDRLFAGCVIAVKADTGEYAWHYQTSIHTENFHVLVTDINLNGTKRHVVMTVPRIGVFYLLDAKSGELISQKNLATAFASPADTEAPPGGGRPRAASGHNWWPMSYNPNTGLVYIPSYDSVTKAGGGPPINSGRLIAWDPVTESARWSNPEMLPTNSGLLSTAGNLVFQGEGTGDFEAFSADRGRKLWSVKTGSAIDSVPVTFMLKGEQYILVDVGLGSFSRMFGRVSAMATTESKLGPSRLYAFKLGATMPFPYPHVVVPPVPRPPEQTASAETIKQGQAVFAKFICGDCHSPGADGSGQWKLDGTVPDLRYMPADVHDQFLAIVLAGTHKEQGMPAFGTGAGFPLIETKMTADEAVALHAYIVDLEWQAFKNDNP